MSTINNYISVTNQLASASGAVSINSGDLTPKGVADDSVNALNTQTSFNSAQNINSMFGLTSAANPFSNLGMFGQTASLSNFYGSPVQFPGLTNIQEPNLDSVLDAPDNAVLNSAAAPVDGAQDGAVASADGSDGQQNGQNSGEQEMLAMMMMMMMGGMGGGSGMSGMNMLGMMGLGGTGMDMSGMGAMGMGGGMGMSGMGGMGGGMGIQAADDSMFVETASYFGEDSGEGGEEISEEEEMG